MEFTGNRNDFSQEQLDKLDAIANRTIQYCTCYPAEQKHPDYAFCSQCENAVSGTEESILKTFIAMQEVLIKD